MALQNIHQFLINVVFGKLGFQKGAFFPFMESVESVGNPNSRFLGPPGLDLRSSHPLREGEHKSRVFFSMPAGSNALRQQEGYAYADNRRSLSQAAYTEQNGEAQNT